MSPEKHILLVEDNADDIELTRLAFEDSHIANRIDVVRDGAEALDYLFARGEHGNREKEPAPALVLLDLNLPKINGLEVLERMRESEKTKYQPVVVLTSSRQQEDLLASYDRGANSFIRKPVDFEKFGEAVKQLQLYWLVLNEAPGLE